MRLTFPLSTIVFLIAGTSLAQWDDLYDLDLVDALEAREAVPQPGYKTEFYTRNADAIIDELIDLTSDSSLTRREARNLMGGGAELVQSAAAFISVMSNGCPTRTSPDFAECDYCRTQAKEKKGGKRRRSLEKRRGGGGRGKGGGGGGHTKGHKLTPEGVGFSNYDCNGWKF